MKETIIRKRGEVGLDFCRLKALFLLCLLTVITAGNVFSQELTITGTVTEETGAVLPGASVVVKGTTTGTLTGSDGSYSIKAERNSILVFSFVGMESMEVPVTNKTQINVTLKTQMVGLDELVVIGYGTQSRKTITTAIAQVGSEKIEEVPIPEVTKALQGKIAGVRILQTTGQPGKDSMGRQIYVYNDDERSVRRGLYYVIREPGKNWSKPRLFYWDKNCNSYPTLIEKEPGVFLCVWDSSENLDTKRTVIRFGILDLNQL